MSRTAELKASIRREIRAQRGAMSKQAQADAAQKLNLELQGLTDGLNAIAVYDAIDGELSVMPFVEWALAQGKRIFYPRVLGPGQMTFCPVDDPDTQLIPGHFGIREPVTAPVGGDEIECFLVPGIAFDADGGRIGFGGGYYDRRLGGFPPHDGLPKIVGVAYDYQVLTQSIPVEPHDVRMHYVVTESRVLASLAHGAPE